MGSPRSRAEQVIRAFLLRSDKDAEATLDTSLFGDGLGLDSLETAELSATLEDEIGSDPFSAGFEPETLGELLGFYEDTVSS